MTDVDERQAYREGRSSGCWYPHGDRDIDHCDDCGVDFGVIPPAPMLQDEVWAAIGEPTERLCRACMFRRARERGIKWCPPPPHAPGEL
jgi:hypothetical protein